MSEQRETWAVTSDDMGEAMSCHVAMHLGEKYIAADFRPVRIPPPDEIEANARDAERWRMLMSGQADVRVIETEFLEEIDPTERIDHEIWINKQIKKGS